MTEIFNRLDFDSAKLKKPNILKKLDNLVLEDASLSLVNMDEAEANRIISHKIESCMKQQTVIGAFMYFTKKFSDRTVKLESSDTIKMMVSKIMKNIDIIKKNIAAM